MTTHEAAGVIEADHLVVGAGAMGMAFVDTLLTHTEATVALVDRYHRPGGHWNHAYPFVRLHQPSFFYGVDSTPLGDNAIDRTGWNAGLSELASGAEVLAYFDHVLHRRFLPSGRVTYLPMSTYDGDGEITSLTSGRRRHVAATTTVDATYMNVRVPSQQPPRYEVASGVRLIPPNGLPMASRPSDGYVVVGGGKTGMDACLWLLDNDVAPASIRWVVPRDSWMINRAFTQPGEGFRIREQLGLVAGAATMDEAFDRLEAAEQLLRVDPAIRPTMYRCATVTTAELEQLRRVDEIVRMGRVQRIEPGTMRLDQGSVAVGDDTVFVDCTSDGLERRPAVPVFAGDRITLQTVRACQQVFSAAFIAYVASTDRSDAERNRICGVVPHPDTEVDFFGNALAHILNGVEWAQHHDVTAWLQASRLDPSSTGVPAVDVDRVIAAMSTIETLLAERDAAI